MPTHAENMISLLEAALEGRLPAGMENYTIEGQAVSKIPITQLADLRQKYRNEQRIATDTANAGMGIRPRRRIGFRFRNP